MKEQNKNKFLCILFSAFLLTGFLFGIFYPEKEYSHSERRKLAGRPELSLDAVWSGKFMTDYEKYTLDQFPMREWMRRIKAQTATKIFMKKDDHNIYTHGDYIAAMEYPMDEAAVQYAGEKFRYVYDQYLSDHNRVYFSVIPDKNYYMAEESGHLSMDVKEMSGILKSQMNFAEEIDITDLLEKDDYYRTDTHWRQEKIVDVACRLAEGMNVQIPENYTEKTVRDDFRGVYWGQAALPIPPENLVYLTNDRIDKMRMIDRQNEKEGSVYNLQKSGEKDPYDLFLSGPLSLVEIENKNADTEKNLILFRDSFGSSIAPLLAQGYKKTVLVDIRYLHSAYLGKLIDFENADVLFLYSTLVLNNSDTLK